MSYYDPMQMSSEELILDAISRHMAGQQPKQPDTVVLDASRQTENPSADDVIDWANRYRIEQDMKPVQDGSWGRNRLREYNNRVIADIVDYFKRLNWVSDSSVNKHSEETRKQLERAEANNKIHEILAPFKTEREQQEKQRQWNMLAQALNQRNPTHNPEYNPKPDGDNNFYNALGIVDGGTFPHPNTPLSGNRGVETPVSVPQTIERSTPPPTNPETVIPTENFVHPIQPIQPTQPAQNPVSENQGTAMANAATNEALQKEKAMWQAQQPNFNPNPTDAVTYRELLPSILGLKQIYENADKPEFQRALGLSADEIRQRAGNSADIYRQLGDYAGADLSGYGSDVSLNDAYANLNSEKARAAIDFFKGEHSKTSEEVFDEKFTELLKGGMRVGKAERIAAKYAQRYQAERVAYMRQMLYGFGYEGRVMTPLGRQIATELAREGYPELANAELQKTPSDLDAYNKESAMAQAIAQLTLGGENAVNLATLNHAFGFEDRADVFDKKIREAVINNDLAIDRYEAEKNIDTARDIFNDKRARLNAKLAASDAIDTQLEMLTKAGFTVEDAYKLVLRKAGYLPASNAEPTKQELAKGILDFAKHLQDVRKTLAENMPEDPKSKEYKLWAQQMTGIDQKLSDAQNIYSSLYGISGTGAVEVPEYDPKNEIANNDAIKQMIIYAIQRNFSFVDVVDMVEQWSNGQIPREEIIRIVNEMRNQNGGDDK